MVEYQLIQRIFRTLQIRELKKKARYGHTGIRCQNQIHGRNCKMKKVQQRERSAEEIELSNAYTAEIKKFFAAVEEVLGLERGTIAHQSANRTAMNHSSGAARIKDQMLLKGYEAPRVLHTFEIRKKVA